MFGCTTENLLNLGRSLQYLAMKHEVEFDMSKITVRKTKRSNYYNPVYGTDLTNAIIEGCPKVWRRNNGLH